MAATIAARADNGVGFAGIAPEATIVRVALGCPAWVDLEEPTDQERGALHVEYLEQLMVQGAAAVRWLVDEQQVSVISISQALGSEAMAEQFGFSEAYQALREALRYAHDGGVVVVIPAGNWVGIWDAEASDWVSGAGAARTQIQGLAQEDFTLAVGCVCAEGSALCGWEHTGEEIGYPQVERILSGHHYGDSLDLVVPCDGVPMVTLQDGSPHYYLHEEGGTSNSAPQISGLLALLLSARPELTPHEAANLLMETATDLFGAGYDVQSGHGLPDINAALSEPTEQAE